MRVLIVEDGKKFARSNRFVSVFHNGEEAVRGAGYCVKGRE